MAEGMKQRYIVINPASLLEALEQVEHGVSAVAVMTAILDIAEDSEEEIDLE